MVLKPPLCPNCSFLSRLGFCKKESQAPCGHAHAHTHTHAKAHERPKLIPLDSVGAAGGMWARGSADGVEEGKELAGNRRGHICTNRRAPPGSCRKARGAVLHSGPSGLATSQPVTLRLQQFKHVPRFRGSKVKGNMQFNTWK